MAKRGRPKKKLTEENFTPDRYERDFIDSDGVRSTWKYDSNITKNGPYETITHWPKNTKSYEQEQEMLPKTVRKYLNEETGKYVAYQRAKELGII